MPRRRKPTTSSGSAGSQRRRSFQSDSSDDWEYEPTRGEVYRDRFYAILRFLWDTTKLTMAWLSFVWLAAHLLMSGACGMLAIYRRGRADGDQE